MGPLRILILLGLLYIGYRLIMKTLRGSTDQEKPAKDSGKTEQLTDVLVEDPVCHKLVPKKQAFQAEVGQETHYFCSKECSDIFLAEKGEES